ncbi:MAG: hypothetical protein WD555_03315 [Fulvivirga sp.]
MKIIITVVSVMALISIGSCESTGKNSSKIHKSYGELALEQSADPVRPGIPGERPFWNTFAKRFIYAPAFDFKTINGAVKYRFDLLSLADSSTYSFETDKPYAALSPVWTKVPVGNVELKVTGVSANGDSLGLAGEKDFYRAAPFAGEYHKPVMSYDSSATLALENLMKEDYVQYWLEHNAPDPEYKNYVFATKIYSALIAGGITYARMKEGTAEAEQSIRLAQIVADYLIGISFPKGSEWEFFPPSYHGSYKGRDLASVFRDKDFMRETTNFTIIAADAGNAYLDLYDYTGEEKYLEAAIKIARTYQETQMDNGTWYQLVNYKTGETLSALIAIPTAIVTFLERLSMDYDVSGLKETSEKALNWVMENPVKSFHWVGQFEDITPRAPYRNLSREQACDLAMYIFKNRSSDREMLQLAEELVRFSEDQFVVWEQPRPETGRNTARNSEHWITPSVQEQYVFWTPVSRSAGIMIETYSYAYEATKDEIYLAKAKSIANALTLVQEAHNGEYPSFFSRLETNKWLNGTVYPAEILLRLSEDLE